jgi:hypothetical protein
MKTDLPWLTPYEQGSPANGHSSVILPEAASPASTASVVSAPSQSVILPEWQPTQRAALTSASAKTAFESSGAATSEMGAKPVWDTTPDNAGPATPTADPFLRPAEAPTSELLRIVPADLMSGEAIQPDPVGLTPVSPDALQAQPWTSAKKTQDWLETVKSHRSPQAEWLAQQWQRRRANVYLLFAAVILLLAITGWGIRPAGTTAAGNAAPATNGQPSASAPAPPDMTLFEKLMVSLGLAEPPPPPVNLGNPNAQVWVDVHTALYYCADSELYGKTADGKFTSQRDAQQDQFEPSNRKACP